MDFAGGFTERATARLGALRRVLSRPVVSDVVIVLLVLGFAIAETGHDHHGHVPLQLGLFALALALPLLWRRRYPAPVFAVIAGTALLQWLTETPLGADIALLFALYALGRYELRRWLIAGAVLVAETGVVMAVVRWAPANEKISSLIALTGTVTAAWVLGVYTRTRQDYLRSVLDRAITAEHERDQQALLAAAGERARISREMHDIVAHSLSVMIALSDGAAAAVRSDPDAAVTTMGQASDLGRQALGEVRRLLGDEHLFGDPEAEVLAPQPGIGQLDDLVAGVRAAGLEVELHLTGHRPDLPPGLQLAVYRLVQEALTNVLKHAPKAARASVGLRYRPDGIDIEVQNDDDPPAPLPRAGAAAGRGLLGMRQRATVFGGSVEAGPCERGGWRVVAHLPLEPAHPLEGSSTR